MSAGPDLEALYDAHAQALYGFLLNLTRNEADTRDVLQEIFAKLARNPRLLNGVAEPRAFLLRLSHNAAIDHMRRAQARNRSAERLAEEPGVLFAPAPAPDEEAFRISLAQALAELPLDQRVVVHLKLWGKHDFRSHRGDLEHPIEHRRQPLSLWVRQIAPAPASFI